MGQKGEFIVSKKKKKKKKSLVGFAGNLSS